MNTQILNCRPIKSSRPDPVVLRLPRSTCDFICINFSPIKRPSSSVSKSESRNHKRRNTPINILQNDQRINIRLLLCMSILSLIFCIRSMAAENVLDGHRDSVIYIESTFKNPTTGEILVESSSGFLISSTGYVIGSKHALEKEGFIASVRGATGSREAALEKLDVVLVSLSTDAALLRFRNTLSNRKPLTVTTDSHVVAGISVYFSGFYGTEEWVQVDGKINSIGGIGGSWLTDLKIGKGSSGGPVMTTDGHVVGIVWGGLTDSDSGAVRIIPSFRLFDLLAVAGAAEVTPSPALVPNVQKPPPSGGYPSDLQLTDAPNSLFDDNRSSLSVRSSGENLLFELEAAQPTITFLLLRFLIDQGTQLPIEKQYGFQSGSLASCVSFRTLGTFGWSICNSIQTSAQVATLPGAKWKVTWTIPKSEVGLTGKANVALCYTEQVIMPFREILF
jgi:hypothetical protein